MEDGISRINVKLRSNEESEINGQGPVITEDNIKKLYEKLDCLKESDVLVLAGSIPDVMPSSMYMDIMKHLEGRGINIVLMRREICSQMCLRISHSLSSQTIMSSVRYSGLRLQTRTM